ncbi:undecaprenyl-diphosphate phosphatase [Nanoarchaeota archaeon]
MVSVFQAIILSVVQSITEWLPVSSSGHLALMQHFFGFQNLTFDVYLHFASILAVIYVFRSDIIKLLDLRKLENQRYAAYLIIAVIPIAIVGLTFRDAIESVFSNMVSLGIFFLISGAIVFSTKFVKEKKEKKRKVGLMESITIGLFQALAILPGISRSGATISAGLFSGLKKEQVIKFSFLLAIPTVLGASVLEARNMAFSGLDLQVLLISFIVTFLVSILAIKLLLKIIRKQGFHWFGVYNILVGLLILIFL